MKTASDREQDLLENVAAISAELWHKTLARGNGPNFYARFYDKLSGFPGVWRFAIEAARIFTAAEADFSHRTGGKANGAAFEYVDAILDFAGRLADAQDLPTEHEMQQWAMEAIARASYNFTAELTRMIDNL